jgi:hypothetical protein
LELARHCTEAEYQALKEALYLAGRHSFVKEFVTQRVGFINELTEEQVAELSQVSPAKEDAEGRLEAGEGEGEGEGFTKDAILRRLNIDLEHIEKILCGELIKEGENEGEIDGGGDDGGGKPSADDAVDDFEFEDAV